MIATTNSNTNIADSAQQDSVKSRPLSFESGPAPNTEPQVAPPDEAAAVAAPPGIMRSTTLIYLRL